MASRTRVTTEGRWRRRGGLAWPSVSGWWSPTVCAPDGEENVPRRRGAPGRSRGLARARRVVPDVDVHAPDERGVRPLRRLATLFVVIYGPVLGFMGYLAATGTYGRPTRAMWLLFGPILPAAAVVVVGFGLLFWWADRRHGSDGGVAGRYWAGPVGPVVVVGAVVVGRNLTGTVSLVVVGVGAGLMLGFVLLVTARQRAGHGSPGR